jgi:hypothetical protein
MNNFFDTLRTLKNQRLQSNDECNGMEQPDIRITYGSNFELGQRIVANFENESTILVGMNLGEVCMIDTTIHRDQ